MGPNDTLIIRAAVQEACGSRAPWAAETETFTYKIPKANLAPAKGHLCQVYAYLLIGMNAALRGQLRAELALPGPAVAGQPETRCPAGTCRAMGWRLGTGARVTARHFPSSELPILRNLPASRAPIVRSGVQSCA